MNSISTVKRESAVAAFALAVISLAMDGALLARAETDPNLNLTITPTNANVVLKWFGSNSVAYQVESSATLAGWTNSGVAINGAGAFLSATNPLNAQGSAYFRVKRLPGPQIITASFDIGTGILTITGDDYSNGIVVSRNGAGVLLVNNGGVVVTGGTPTVANTTLIRLYGRGSDDQLSLDEANGALPKAEIFGEAGNDTLTGGSGADSIYGGPGNDTLLGKGGTDFLFGGTDDDVLIGGDADDQVFGEAGNDRMVWNPGDDTDLNEGGTETDTVEVNGGNGAEQFTATANGLRVRFDRISPAPFMLDIGTCENLVLSANGGDDSFSATGNLAALIQITVDGGSGNDTILGSNGNDLLLGGDGDDFIDGQQGNDTVFLGANNDTFQWDPGDGSDIVEGQAGTDKLIFNGSAVAESYDVAANGARVRLTRNVGTIVMDLAGMERLDLKALGGTDTVNVNNLSGTELVNVNIDLASPPDSGTGDTVADTVIVNGTDGADLIDVTGSGTSASVLGLSAQVSISGSEGTNDALVVNGFGGDDQLTATTLPAGVLKLTLDGGAQNDSLLGSQGADILLGGDGDDTVFGDNGNDVAFLGANNDIFRWDPGDGSDTVEGQDGSDTLLFYGANVAENIGINANGARVLFVRDIGAVSMDLNAVESIDFKALGGADNISVGDLTGTDVTGISLDLRGSGGGGDAAADTVTVNGTPSADNFGAAGNANGVTVSGLHTAVSIVSPEQVNDRLTLNGQAGDDVVDSSSLTADGIPLTVNGGLGADVILGSQGSDLIIGGDGNDVALMGPGNDTFVWNPGDDNDTVEGQAGTDTLQFNGSAVAESYFVTANGGRVQFTRDIAAVVMDLNGLETLDLRPLSGNDNITVNDLTGTDLSAVNVNLTGTLGGATTDGYADLITINGTAAPDNISLTANTGIVQVSGLSAAVLISNPEPAYDRVTVNGLGGVDVITVGPGVTTLIAVTANQ